MRSRRGSALLIVLGMLAFMVISAVAFSAYMRYSRLPSSFLRRQVSSRLLIKAALSRAIDEVDAAIGNNPHPNVGTKQYRYPREPRQGQPTYSWNRNHWKQRVFMGGTNVVNCVPMVAQQETVSPLCLEALAYLPPSIVNEVRYYSRHTQTAKWHELDYDAGRYAYCAVDVSDYFDVNALHADTPRLSSPGCRVSLSYLFEDEDHAGPGPLAGMCSPTQWDDFMAKFLPQGSTAGNAKGGNSGGGKLPLVSLADFNLALGYYKPGGMVSPFYDYLTQNKANFYGFSSDSVEAERMRRMTFVTDSWMPQGLDDEDSQSGNNSQTSNETKLDLTQEKNQPFSINDLTAGGNDNGGYGFYSIIDYSSQGEASTEIKRYLSGLGMCQLFDYLDKDSTPLSLAIPTLERHPMICGIDIGQRSGALKVNAQTVGSPDYKFKSDPTVDSTASCTVEVKYEIEGIVDQALSALVVFPFRNQLPSEDSFEIGGRLSYFLSLDGDDAVRLRTGNADDILHPGKSGSPMSVSGTQPENDAVYSVELKGSCPQPKTFSIESQGQEGAVKKVTLTPQGRIPRTIDFLQVKYVYESENKIPAAQYRDMENPPKQGDTADPKYPMPKIGSVQNLVAQGPKCSWVPLAKNGSASSAFTTGLAGNLVNQEFAKNLKLNVAVWIWIKNTKTGKVVDLVPACANDDNDFNQVADQRSIRWGQNRLGSPYPMMRFDLTQNGTAAIEFKAAGCEGNTVVQAANGNNVQLEAFPRTVYVGDPRFNHAPESWFYVNANDALLESDWLKYCGCTDGNRDGDIFMQTSDQGYMQSFYELANMLRFKEFDTTPNDTGWYQNPDDGRTAFAKGTFANGRNSEYMWRTYDPFMYPNGNVPGDDFESSRFVSGGEGFKVSPYASTNILMAAFANTPLEWRFAADSEMTDGKVQSVWDNVGDVKTFNQQYCWNEYSSGSSKMYWEDLFTLATQFSKKIHDKQNDPDYTWRDAFEDLDWAVRKNHTGDDAFKYLTNDIEVDTDVKSRIYNCDRKFLYGFWRESMAVKQQLFLVFVRAEPMMMGGGVAGAVPPSLGARAVALVWRDPTASQSLGTGVVAPHRTRILFYRQFD